MTGQYILSDYLTRLVEKPNNDNLEDGAFFGRIPARKGVVAFVYCLSSGVIKYQI